MSEQEEFSRYMGRPVAVMEIFSLKRELTTMLHRERVYRDSLKRRDAERATRAASVEEPT